MAARTAPRRGTPLMPLLVLLVAALALIVAENAAAAAAPPPRWAVRLWLDEDGALVDAAAAAEPASWREEEVALLRRYAATLPDAIATAERRSLRLERRAATAVKRAQARARSVDAGRALADALGLVHVDTVGELLDTHVLSVPDKAAGAANASAADAFEAALRAHPWVRWVERQWPRARQLRAAVPSFNDPQFKDQWHLYNQASPGNDEQVVEVWAQGITGAGVVVAMVDDGVHYKHPDLTDAINWDGTFNFVNKNYDPTPQFGDDHGTRCAAQIVAKPNNGVCGVGIAYGAQLSAIRLIGAADPDDAAESDALGYERDINDIYSNSWGPSDDGRTVDGPGELTQRTLAAGVTKGRDGLGNIFVFACGNGAEYGDDCNFDGFANSIYTIPIGALMHTNKIAPYSEGCAALVGVTYSSGGDLSITTATGNNGCTSQHTGTSAAAPLAAGIVALLLSQRPELTWRDVQHVLIRSAQPVEDYQGGEWITNAAGRQFSRKYGFGLITARAVLDVAKTYQPLSAQEDRAFTVHTSNVIHSRLTVAAGALTRATYDAPAAGTGHYMPLTLEHVAVRVRLTHAARGFLTIQLQSPQGTSVVLAPPRYSDASKAGYDWTFTSRATWDENPAGTWTLEISNPTGNVGELVQWEILFYGQGYASDASSTAVHLVEIILGSLVAVLSVCGCVTMVRWVRNRQRTPTDGWGGPATRTFGYGPGAESSAGGDDDDHHDDLTKAFGDEEAGADATAADADAPGAAAPRRRPWWPAPAAGGDSIAMTALLSTDAAPAEPSPGPVFTSPPPSYDTSVGAAAVLDPVAAEPLETVGSLAFGDHQNAL